MPLAGGGARRDGVTKARRFDPARIGEAAEAPPPCIPHRRGPDEAAPGEPPGHDHDFPGHVFGAVEGTAGARACLDETCAVHVALTREALTRPGPAPVLAYRQRRFGVIRRLEAQGHVEGWRAE